MLLAHKIRLKLNNKQATYCAKAAGTARFAYNWALDIWKLQYQAHRVNADSPKPSEGALRCYLNAIKREQFPWMLEVTKCAAQEAIRQLGVAFGNFFAKRAKYPTKRKKGVHDRFVPVNHNVKVDGSRIYIPRLGWVRMCEILRFSGKIMSATISKVAQYWYVSIVVETNHLEHLSKTENQGAVGVYLGVSALATLSTGEKTAGPKPLKRLLCGLQRLSKNLSRRQKGSANRLKARKRLAQLHAKIAAIRKDALHKLTSDLTRKFHTIGIEDLNVFGMMRNGKLARCIADMGFYELRRQLDYKSWLRGGNVVVANRFFS